MNRKTVVVGLFADRMDVLVCLRDDIIASRRIECTFGTDPISWRKTVDDAGRKLGAVVDELKVSDLPCFVLYRNPTAYTDATSLAVSSSSHARQAAVLGCAESLSCPLDDAATTTYVIGRDRSGDPPHTHVAVAADHDDALAALAAMVTEAGLQFLSATPIDAVLMARTASRALHANQSNQGYLYIGEQRSFFVIADHGRILFCRQINLGSESLASGLTKSIRAAQGVTLMELTLSDARDMLFRVGIPKRDQIVHETLGLVGSQIIPLMQPVLQRFTVELRQSLRFGVPEEHRQSVQLHVSGPGGAIPNLPEVIGAELGLSTHVDQQYSAFSCIDPASAGSEIGDVLSDSRLHTELELRPTELATARAMTRLQRWLWAGAAAALIVIAADTVHYQSKLSRVKDQIAALESQSIDRTALQQAGEKLFKAITAMDNLEAEIAKECNTAINVRACLQEFSSVTPDSIRLMSIAFSQDKGKTVGRLTGHAVDHNDVAGRTQIEPFVHNLKSSPLFDDVTLSNVQAGTVNGTTGHQFVITLAGVTVPRTMAAPTLVKAGDSTP